MFFCSLDYSLKYIRTFTKCIKSGIQCIITTKNRLFGMILDSEIKIRHQDCILPPKKQHFWGNGYFWHIT